MFRPAEPLYTPAAESARPVRPDDAAETLRYVASDSFAARLEAWDREDLPRYSEWVARPENWINDIARDLGMRMICRHFPTIVWG